MNKPKIHERLTEVEALLAKRLDISNNVREELIRLAKSHQLVEDELVAEWYELYSSYLDDMENG